MKLNKYVQGIMALLPAIIWMPVAVLLSFEGAWMSPIAERGDDNTFMRYAKQTMSGNLKGNGALVLVENGEVVGSYYQSAVSANHITAQSVNGDTLFPAASLSKFVAALSIHKLAQLETISLNAPAERYIESWRLPLSIYDHNQVTIARLLSHTAGLTDGLGFGDYSEQESLPSLLESLDSPRSSSGDKRIEVGIEPGREFQYSGGSYLLLELLIEDITGENYESWVERNVFQPRGLARSHFDFIDKFENSSSFYNNLGQKVPSLQYASSAATALNTSANDLVALLQSIIAEPKLLDVLSTPVAEVMGTPIWGLGAMLYARLPQEQFIIGHDGSNDPAINTSIRINPMTGDGYIALVSGHKTLASEIGFEWVLWQSGKPDFIFSDKAINSSLLPIIIGSLGWMILLVFYFKVVKRAKK